MKTTFLIAACYLTGVLVLQAEDILTTRTETFHTGTGFLSFPQGVTTEGFDIGWRDSNRAGGAAPGEFGGTFARASRPFHYWADIDIGDVSRRDELEVTGKFVITEDINMDGWIHVGYINRNAVVGGGHSVRNELGMAIAEPFSAGGIFRVSAVSQNIPLPEPFRRYDNAPGRVPIGEKASFRFVWMPSAGRNGTGTATLTVTLESGGEFVSIVEEPRIPEAPDEMEFDAFIIGGSLADTLDFNRKMVAFFDDITYTVRGAPASKVDVFGGEALGDGWFSSSWYGTYNAAFWPWVNHLQHNFQFVFETDAGGEVFLFDSGSGSWWYTSASIYPSVYMFDRNSWAFYFVDTANPRNFADLASGEFFNVD